MKRPRLNALRAFEAAARHLSFSAAGTELGISQAAVSQQMRQLEAYLGAPLFVRRNRGLSLTGAGEAYRLAVAEALERLDVITDQLFPGRDAHVVTVQCTPSVAMLWLVPRLDAFRAAHPGIQLRIATLDTRRDRGRAAAEIEIVPLDSGAADPDCRRLMTASVSPVCAPALLGDRVLERPDEVLGFALLHVLGYAEDWHRWFRAMGLAPRRPPAGVSFDGSLMAIEAAIRGEGLLLGRRPFIDGHLASGRLVPAFAAAARHLEATYYLRVGRVAGGRRDVAAVVEWLAAMAAGEAS